MLKPSGGFLQKIFGNPKKASGTAVARKPAAGLFNRKPTARPASKGMMQSRMRSRMAEREV